MNTSARTLALVAGLVGSILTTGCGEEKMTIEEALATNAEKEFEKSGKFKPTPTKPPPTMDLPPPSEEEFAAWDRKDPAGERHLYKWDKRNLKRMREYWVDMQCFRDRMHEEAKKSLTAAPQSPEDEKWYQFKRMFIPFINRWQQRLFSLEPRIQEKSKFISNFLEAHELVMHGYPDAYNNKDELQIRKVEAHWLIVNKKVNRYVEQLGGKSWEKPDITNARAAKAWDKRCAKAMTEPKVSKKGKRKRNRRRDP